MHLDVQTVSYPLKQTFAITGKVFETSDTIKVTLRDEGYCGVGEAVGAFYRGETTNTMTQDLEAVRGDIDSSLSSERIQEILPPGGARNALDCAFWDLRAKRTGQSVWSRLGITPKPLGTVYTIGLADPTYMARTAAAAIAFPKLKIKLDGNRPIEKLEAIRAQRPDAQLIVDVNQGWSFAELREYVPHCERLGILMLEQPLARGQDEPLESYKSAVPLGADESCLHLGEFATVANRYQVLNIKLDKCGGLTEGLRAGAPAWV